MIGLYPEMGRDYYYLIPPLFPDIRMRVGGDNILHITAPNAGEGWIHIQSATLNGIPLDRAFIHHNELVGGGTLELVLSQEPKTSI